jgi:hypothetical protein
MALTCKGELYTFGDSKDGKLGYDEINPCVYIPRKLYGSNLPLFAKKEEMKERSEKYPLFANYNDDFIFRSENR